VQPMEGWLVGGQGIICRLHLAWLRIISKISCSVIPRAISSRYQLDFNYCISIGIAFHNVLVVEQMTEPNYTSSMFHLLKFGHLRLVLNLRSERAILGGNSNQSWLKGFFTFWVRVAAANVKGLGLRM
jgi:hypothetical protein